MHEMIEYTHEERKTAFAHNSNKLYSLNYSVKICTYFFVLGRTSGKVCTWSHNILCINYSIATVKLSLHQFSSIKSSIRQKFGGRKVSQFYKLKT